MRFASFSPPGGCDLVVTGSMKFDGVKGIDWPRR
jgi:hypothetical protein